MKKQEQHKKLSIAFVSDAVYPYNKGGKEKRIYEITTRLVKAGHKVTIYCMKWWKGKELERVEQGVTLCAISPLYPLYSGKRRSMRQAIFFAFSCFKLLAKDFDILDADHMPHLILFPLKIVALIKRKKLYTTWNEVWGRKYWVDYLGILGNIAYLIEWVSVRLPDVIVAVSEHTKEKLRHDLKTTQHIYVVSNGIDLTQIKNVKPAKETSDVIFAGRLLSHKNVDSIVKAIALLKKTLPQIKALIIGEGPEKPRIEKLVKRMHLQANVFLMNFLKEQKDVYSYMMASKVFVFPSTREGFGIAALEANACGIPVITSDGKDNATKYLIKNGQNGFVTKPQDKQIAEKISDIILSQKKYSNTQHIAQYDWSQIAKDIERIYSL